MTTLYPVGYGTQLVSLSRLREIHAPHMHPQFDDRLFPWIASMGGLIGIGDGERPNPDPVSPASMQGRSFHQLQRFRSGLFVYSAVDLVARNPGQRHRAPRWAEVATAPRFALHAFIGHDTPSTTDDEPWHMQCIEMRGYQTWLDANRPDPLDYQLPTEDDMDYRPEIPPKRLFDSRGLGGKVQVGQLIPFNIDRQCVAAMLNFTITEPNGAGFLSAWGQGNQPATSNVNWDKPGAIISNFACLDVDNGVIRFTVAGNEAHVIVDLFGIIV